MSDSDKYREERDQAWAECRATADVLAKADPPDGCLSAMTLASRARRVTDMLMVAREELRETREAMRRVCGWLEQTKPPDGLFAHNCLTMTLRGRKFEDINALRADLGEALAMMRELHEHDTGIDLEWIERRDALMSRQPEPYA